MTAFERSGKKKIAPASCQKLGHQRRVLRTVLMGGKTTSGANIVKARYCRKIDLAPGSLDIEALLRKPRDDIASLGYLAFGSSALDDRPEPLTGGGNHGICSHQRQLQGR
jgi:hypothetical protein